MTEPGERLPWRPDPLGAAVLLVLTAIAGSLDAVAFVSLGGTFVGNQTGTVLLLVMGATDRAPVETGAAAASLGSFIVGAALAGRVLPTTAPGRPWPQHTRTVLLVEVALIASGAALSAIDDIHSAAVVAPIALAMGLQAGLARRVALPYLTAAFITGATTDGAMKSPLGDRSTRWWWLAGMPILALVVGAAIGAFLVTEDTGVALSVIATFTAVALGLTMIHPHEPAEPHDAVDHRDTGDDQRPGSTA